MEIEPLHPDFGVAVTGVDAAALLTAPAFPTLRALFETHSLLLLPGLTLSAREHLALAARFGPVEVRPGQERDDGLSGLVPVSNLGPDGQVLAPTNTRLRDLEANRLWHTDATFLPTPALANLLYARVVPPAGGETAFVSTRCGWQRLPAALKARLRTITFEHRIAHSRSRVDPALARQPRIQRWGAARWRAVWTNPVNGLEAAYLASHICAADGMPDRQAQALAEDLITAMTRPEDVYCHRWRPGDLVIWDERATLHRGLPWDLAAPRVLDSVCVSATEADGLPWPGAAAAITTPPS